jgi:hypothetical protein
MKKALGLQVWLQSMHASINCEITTECVSWNGNLKYFYKYIEEKEQEHNFQLWWYLVYNMLLRELLVKSWKQIIQTPLLLFVLL